MARLGKGLLFLCGGLHSAESRQDTAFLAPTVTGQDFEVKRPVASVAARAKPGAEAVEGSTIGSRSAFAAAAAAVTLLGVARQRSKVTRHYRFRDKNTWTIDRKWWHIEDTRDPTTLPFWQRDWQYGWEVLKRTMIEKRGQGIRVFWDCRVISIHERGCCIEMLNSGLPGWVPISEEGRHLGRLEVGDVKKMECMSCPMTRINKRGMVSNGRDPWYRKPRKHKCKPIFSYWNYLEQQKNIKAAQNLENGTIIKCKVKKHIQQGMLMTLEGEDRPKGMLKYQDVSRKRTEINYAKCMWPIGTDMYCFVIHSDKENGRITLGTKEFEDDDHMGWNLSFPEYTQKNREEGIRRYNEKRDAYILHQMR